MTVLILTAMELFIRDLGFRVDGLGRCLHTNHIPEGVIDMQKFRNSQYNLHLKREVLNHYAFNMAFENSIESGYVTEKPFDALIGGSVPVYLGDAEHLKTVLPHPKAAIFVADYDNLTLLTDYLKYLSTNATAYEEHHEWRKEFQYDKNIEGKPLMMRSWQCRVCDWAARQYWLAQQDNLSSRSGNTTSKISNKACDSSDGETSEGEGRKTVSTSQSEECLPREGWIFAIDS
eukprot:gene5068-5433_t